LLAHVAHHARRHVVGYLALFVALGGTSYAAIKQIAAGAVGSSEVRDRSLLSKDFKSGQIPTGPQGPAGPKGDTGATGQQGPKGDTGPAGPLLDTLPSGRTLRGEFGIYGVGHVDNGIEAASESISFPIALATAPNTKVVQNGTASLPPDCPGTAADPAAAPGWLCVYENRAQNQRTGNYPSVSAPGSGFSPSAGRFGATLVLQGQAGGAEWFYWSEGTWAVTAP
jgi:hypothetical protein